MKISRSIEELSYAQLEILWLSFRTNEDENLTPAGFAELVEIENAMVAACDAMTDEEKKALENSA